MEFFQGFPRIVRSIRRLPRDEAHEPVSYQGGEVSPDFTNRLAAMAEVIHRRLGGIASRERRFLRQHVVKNTAERIQIGALVERAQLELLGRDEVDRAEK